MVLRLPEFWSNWNLEMLDFDEGKTGVPGEKPLRAKERTNNKLNPHMVSMPGFEPGPHWWKASALTTAPSLAPQVKFWSCGTLNQYVSRHPFKTQDPQSVNESKNSLWLIYLLIPQVMIVVSMSSLLQRNFAKMSLVIERKLSLTPWQQRISHKKENY